jgi:hypothetical protein
VAVASVTNTDGATLTTSAINIACATEHQVGDGNKVGNVVDVDDGGRRDTTAGTTATARTATATAVVQSAKGVSATETAVRSPPSASTSKTSGAKSAAVASVTNTDGVTSTTSATNIACATEHQVGDGNKVGNVVDVDDGRRDTTAGTTATARTATATAVVQSPTGVSATETAVRSPPA